VQGVGAGPAATNVNSTADFGVGAFLLAGTEVVKMAKGTLPAPNNFSLRKAEALNNTQIYLYFSGKVEKTSAVYPGNYSIDNGAVIKGFTYNSNNREIYFIISELLSKGIDKDEIYRKVFNTYSEGRLRLMGYVLYDRMQVYPQFRSALITLSKAEQSRFQYVKGDTEGFVNIPLQMKGICFSVFLREDSDKNMIKVSLRSVGHFPCNKVAAEFFNGGGHLNASGGEFYGTMEEAVELFKRALVKYEDLLLKN
jgi:hypothetical protein